MTKPNDFSRRAALGLVGATLATPFLSKMAAAAAEVTLRFHHFVPPQSATHRLIHVPWAEKVMAESEGRIAVEIFPSMQLGGSPPQLIEQARKGIVDIVWSVPSYNPGRYPVAETGTLPFMVTSASSTSTALQTLQDEFAPDEFKGVKVISVHTHGSGMIHTREKPIETAADFEGLRMRVPSRPVGALMEALGAEAIYMPSSELPVSLANGVIDGTVMPLDGVPVFKLQELTSFHTSIEGDRGLYTTPFALCMGQRSYESLPDDLRAVIDANSGIETTKWIGKTWEGFEAYGQEAVDKAGNPVNVINEAETAKIREAANGVIDGHKTTLSDAGLDADAIVGRFDELLTAGV